MTNIALGKKVEEPVHHAEVITNGEVTGYTDSQGYGEIYWPGFVTIDLGDQYVLHCIRFLLWDGLGQGGGQRAHRIYKYRLLVSSDYQSWKVLFDSAEDGSNGWQVFDFPDGMAGVRYIRIHGLWNSVGPGFHIVEIEAFDNSPPSLEAECMLQRTISDKMGEEIGDGLPLSFRVGGIINSIERLVESTNILNPQPFKELILQLRIQVNDITALEKSMISIRREITDPVQEELEKSSKLGKFSVWGFWVGIIGGVLAIISIILNLVSMFTID